MASPHRGESLGAGRLRRTAARPRLPRRYRSLAAHPPSAPQHGLVEVTSLPVRRPWWLVAARHAALRLGRLHTPEPASAPVPVEPSTAVPAPVRRAPLTRHPVPVARSVSGPGSDLAASRPSLGTSGPRLGAPGHRRGVPVDGRIQALAARVHDRPMMSRPVPLTGPIGPLVPIPAPAPVGGTVTARPGSAPEVSVGNVGELPVLGGAPVAGRSGGFDVSGAVTVSPRPPSPVASAPVAATTSAPISASALMRAARSPGSVASVQRAVAPGLYARAPLTRTVPGLASRTPSGPAPSAEARWRAAVASRPLESPRPFPTRLRPLVESLTGSAQRASYTTGPATRDALSAAGAVGASTGTVVHLPTAPTGRPGPLLGVVAHELAHTRNPVSRPRFLLEVPHGAADAEERAAQAVGRRVQAAGDQVASLGAGIVGDLPVGGSGRIPDVGGMARAALGGQLPDVGGAATAALDGQLPDVHLPDVSLPEVRLPDVAPPSVPDVHQAGATVTHAAAGLAGSAAGALGGAVSGALGGVDIDHLAEVLEQRVLRQLERRGGRYSGMF